MKATEAQICPAKLTLELCVPHFRCRLTSLPRRLVISDARSWVDETFPPEEILTADTALAEDPTRRLIIPDRKWAGRALSSTTTFTLRDIGNPPMSHVDLWLARSDVIPTEMAPVMENRILQIIPGQDKNIHSDEWLEATLHESLVYLRKTGANKDGQMALALSTLLRIDGIISPRSGNVHSLVAVGAVTRCVDYTSQPVAAGPLHFAGVDFGGQNLHKRPHTNFPVRTRQTRTQPVCCVTFGIVL